MKDYDKNWCLLTFKAPESDGGQPITHYIVEKKDKYSSKWIKHMETKSPKCEAKVTDLIEGQQYNFRVKAVNKAGPSVPSDPSDTFTAKAKNRKQHDTCVILHCLLTLISAVLGFSLHAFIFQL